jgi:16S rRNA (cytosine967-C5)-methyltransferase
VLDLCAAPGMKAALLASLMARGDLTACDLRATRLKTLKKLLGGALPPDIRLRAVQLDATRSLPFQNSFDRILLDAPCSGTGTLARNPEIKWRLAERDITRHAEAQKAMLRNALPLLAPEGRLVYATCSLEPEENEQVVDSVLSEHPEFRRVLDLSQEFPRLAPLIDAQGNFRTRPDLHGTDGFFAAVLARQR